MERKTEEFLITITLEVEGDHSTGYVEIETDAEEFIFYAMLAEYSMNMAARKSGQDYDEAVKILCEGSRTYKSPGEGKVLRMPK